MTQNPKTSLKKTSIPWIGEIPEDWGVRRLKMLTNIKRGASPRPIDDQKYFDENGEFAWVRISDVTASNIYLEKTEQQLSELGASLSVKQYPGDLFLSIAGTVGKPIFAKIRCCIHDGFVTFSSLTEQVNRMFLFYILHSGQAYFGLGKEGSQLNLNIDTVGNISIPFPPFPTQTAIAKFLDQKTEQIGTLITNKKSLITLLREQKKAIIHRAVTKGIDKNETMKDSGVSWIGEIPESWDIVPFSKYFTSVIDYRGKTPEKVNFSDYILVTTRNIKDGIIDYSLGLEYVSKEGYEDSRGRGLPKKGDIIFTMEAPLGECALVDNEDVTFGQRIVKFRLNHKFIPEYAIYSMKSFFFQSILQVEATGSTVLGLKSSKIHKLKFILPSIEAQKTIIEYIKEETSQIETAIRTIEDEIRLIEEYRTSLIYQAVTGKISIS